jgi:hypothetical protein
MLTIWTASAPIMPRCLKRIEGAGAVDRGDSVRVFLALAFQVEMKSRPASLDWARFIGPLAFWRCVDRLGHALASPHVASLVGRIFWRRESCWLCVDDGRVRVLSRCISVLGTVCADACEVGAFGVAALWCICCGVYGQSRAAWLGRPHHPLHGLITKPMGGSPVCHQLVQTLLPHLHQPSTFASQNSPRLIRQLASPLLTAPTNT